MAPLTAPLTARLRQRARTAGADPLLTYYEPAAGTRVELSALTLLNWVDKTCHLLEELEVAPGDPVRLVLAEGAPGHWVTAVWELACWQLGAEVVLSSDLAPDPRAPAADLRAGAGLLVTGPDWAPYVGLGPDVVACSLHPLGLPLGQELPSSVLDYALEVRGQADHYDPLPTPADGPAWRDADRTLTQADLVAAPPLPSARRLVRPGTAWETARQAVVTPLLSGGSSVVVAGEADAATLARVTAEERVDR